MVRTDFNPSQAGFAQELAAASGAGAQLFDQAFAEFCNRPDLPDFDFIGLHGLWSWISDENRAVIVDFIRRKLKVGGVLYISYNAQPGWAAMVPMRDLLAEYSEVMGAPGRVLSHESTPPSRLPKSCWRRIPDTPVPIRRCLNGSRR